MDEADILGDRIAIMHEGQVFCYGSGMFLKTVFGSLIQFLCHCIIYEITMPLTSHIFIS